MPREAAPDRAAASRHANVLAPLLAAWRLSGAGAGLDDRGYYFVVQVYVLAQVGGRR